MGTPTESDFDAVLNDLRRADAGQRITLGDHRLVVPVTPERAELTAEVLRYISNGPSQVVPSADKTSVSLFYPEGGATARESREEMLANLRTLHGRDLMSDTLDVPEASVPLESPRSDAQVIPARANEPMRR